MEYSARHTVMSFIKALNEEDFDVARKLMNDNATFQGVLGTRDGADSYIEDMKKMKLKYEVLKCLTMRRKFAFGTISTWPAR